MRNNILPLGALTHWFSETKPPHCADNIATWLYDHNSLTQKLETHFKSFSVEIKQQLNVTPNKYLSPLFKQEEKILVREVFLHCNNKPVVLAQTEIPFSTLTEQQLALAEIGEQSLGTILFQDPSMLRGQIEVTEFEKGSFFHQLVSDLGQPANHSLWARRSLFYLQNKPLLVSELFLPASGIYNE
ncbi:chorismate--pyruvate lyase [Psychromonas sp. psych-6C06]|uniref:chorismate--pyruvate lyase family protein n=1 Tax=Psychromonas sp. psych-6C06 TaxID=2058089 RepID=UPI000C334564|nr:chorismate lyase [Psychromonas sp. psych-6C06]PKF63070.1 chorismate--pyruvate lyase [Psychromonas sp. psych-6C06]